MKIAGVVVLFNPTNEVVTNIHSYINSLDKLYVVDNSETISDPIINAIISPEYNIEYIPLQQNQGIARALNIAAFKALEEGYDWLLTMDQDSQVSHGMVEKLLSVSHSPKKEQIGVIAPRYDLPGIETQIAMHGLQEVEAVITSGNLLNLKAFQNTGPFREDFFIDYVDYEYCLRLRLKNYKIIVNNDVILNHVLGNLKKHELFGLTFTASHHNSVRRYYITRNRLTLLKEYKDIFPDFYRNEKNNNLKEVVKLLLFEKNKFKKIKSVIEGYIDFKSNRFGKYRY
jgi:rhamnosyltransferase